MKSSQQEKIVNLKLKLWKYELYRYMAKFSQNGQEGSGQYGKLMHVLIALTFYSSFADTHFSLVRIIESLQQLNSSAFSTATGTN